MRLNPLHFAANHLKRLSFSVSLAARRAKCLDQVQQLHPKAYFGVRQYAWLYWRNLRLGLQSVQRSAQQALQSPQTHPQRHIQSAVHSLLSSPALAPVVGVHHAIEHVLTLQESEHLSQSLAHWLSVPAEQRERQTLAVGLADLVVVLGCWRLYGMIYLRSCFKGALALTDDTATELMGNGFGLGLGHYALKSEGKTVALLRVVLKPVRT